MLDFIALTVSNSFLFTPALLRTHSLDRPFYERSILCFAHVSFFPTHFFRRLQTDIFETFPHDVANWWENFAIFDTLHLAAMTYDDCGGPRSTPVAYNGPLQANTVLCSFNTIQPSSFNCRPSHSTTGARISTRIVALTPSIKNPTAKNSVNFGQGTLP